jgi:hypothetical protein
MSKGGHTWGRALQPQTEASADGKALKRIRGLLSKFYI